MTIVFIYLLLVNLAGFGAFGLDKYKAVHNKWRIRENALLLFAILGGGIGCLLGMKLFHHKTFHRKFTVGIPVILILQILLILFLFTKSGEHSNTPRGVVTSELSGLKSASSQQVDEILMYQDLFPSESVDKTISDDIASIFTNFFSDFSYTIKKVEEDEHHANVTVRITSLDGRKLAREYSIQALIQQITNSATPANVTFSLEDCYLILADILKNESIPSFTTDYQIPLEKQDGKWILASPKELSALITGGFPVYVADANLLTPSEIVSIHIDTLKNFDTEQLSRFLALDHIFDGDMEYKRSISKALAQQLLTYLDYQVISEKISPDNAQAAVQIQLTSCDCRSIINQYQDQVTAYIKTAQALEDGIAGRLTTANGILEDCITSNTASVTTPITIYLKNDGANWRLEMSAEMSDALLGNIGDAILEVSEKLQ